MEIWPNQNYYLGFYRDGFMEGYGVFVWVTQKGTKEYEGQWSRSLQHGVGKWKRYGKVKYRKYQYGQKV